MIDMVDIGPLNLEQFIKAFGPRRAVAEHPSGWAVSDSDFITTDRALAIAVAREYDRIDPLPGSYPAIGTERLWSP